MNATFCIYCMHPLPPDGSFCPSCGRTASDYQPAPHHLKPGTILDNRYLVGRVLGEGGFGITYIGCDLKLKLKVAIKEYYPSDLSSRNTSVTSLVTNRTDMSGGSFERGKDKFLKEAQNMAKLDKLTAIVGVRDFFEANNTAYIIMEYIEGTTLRELVRQKGCPIPPSELFPIIQPLFQTLSVMHENGLIHRDISPDNMMLEHGSIRLLDFGCARESFASDYTMTIMLKNGYSPIEQYSALTEDQGPWSDVYALCATIYFCITGIKPPPATNRIFHDPLVLPSKCGIPITPWQEYVLLKGMHMNRAERYQTMSDLQNDLYGPEQIPPPLTPYTNEDRTVAERENHAEDATEVLTRLQQTHEEPFYTSDTRLSFQSEISNTDASSFSELKCSSIDSNNSADSEAPHSSADSSNNAVNFSAKEMASPIEEKAVEKPGASNREPAKETISHTRESLSQTESKKKSRMIPVVTGICGIFILAAIYFFINTSKVPNISGQPLDDAVALLENASFEINNIEYADDDTIPKGCVITVSSTGRLKKHTSLNLTVSNGIHHILPNLIGKTFSEAEKTVSDMDFTLNTIKEYSDTIVKDQVISQDPVSGTDLDSGNAVTLTVSLGPVPFELKSYVNMDLNKAKKSAEKLGLEVKTEERDSKEKSIGTVLSQSPKAGEQIQKGDTITFAVSRGIQIPNVKEKSEAEVKKLLKNTGFKVETKTVFHDTIEEGLVISQTEKAKTYAEPGSVIHLSISKGVGAKVPDLEGKSRKSAEAALLEAGLKLGDVTTRTTSHSSMDDSVATQSSDPGTMVSKGTAVSITLYTYEPPATQAPSQQPSTTKAQEGNGTNLQFNSSWLDTLRPSTQPKDETRPGTVIIDGDETRPGTVIN